MATEGTDGALRAETRMMRNVLIVFMCATASAMVSAADWPMWGGTPSRNMVSDEKGLPTTWDLKTGKNVKWVAELGSQSYGNPDGRRRRGAGRHQQRSDARPEAGRRSRRRDGVSRRDRRVHVAGDLRKARLGPRQRLAVPGYCQLAADHARRRLLYDQPRHHRGGRHPGLS